jgi:serine/threonine-protein kinase
VLKVLLPELASVTQAGRFVREIEIAAQLTHPRIVPLYDSGEAAGLSYYVMPYVDGPSLRDRLQAEGRLEIAEAVRIASDVAKALDFAHQHGVVHRDIKPDNILLLGDEALVTDFGIARAIAAAGGTKLTQSGMTIGTPPYMSPEQARGRGDVDGRSDLYSLACVVYEMLAGHPPFTAESPQELLARHAFDPVPTLRAARPDVPALLERAVLKALAKAPADRFATVALFAHALTTETPEEPPSGGRRLSQAFRQIFDRPRRPRSD